MLIGDAKKMYLGDTEVIKAYLGSTLVWTKPVPVLKSSNVTTAGNYTVGTAVTKDMTSATRSTGSAYTPNRQLLSSIRSYWQDWGNDIFDGWGFFYLFNNANSQYINLVLSSVNNPDGQIATQTFTNGGRTFTVKHGFPVQGIYKFDISVNDDLDFQFGMDGGLGSDVNTLNVNYSYDHTDSGESLKLYYNYNVQANLTTEDFYVYVVPYEIEKNKATIPYNNYKYNTDNLAIYTKPVKKGVTVYIAKQNDVKDWIVNDLVITV